MKINYIKNIILYKYNIMKIFNDVLYGSIELSDTAVKIIDTPEYQRLRFIKQLGSCQFIY